MILASVRVVAAIAMQSAESESTGGTGKLKEQHLQAYISMCILSNVHFLFSFTKQIPTRRLLVPRGKRSCG